MIHIGLAGKAGAGKDEVGNYLVKRYGFIKYSFGDFIRQELARAYGLVDTDALTDRQYKETPAEALALGRCADQDFVKIARAKIIKEAPDTPFDLDTFPLSPRWLQQTWGSEYRRARNPDYWVLAAADWITRFRAMAPYPEMRAQRFVNCSVRFTNEREFVKSFGDSNVWHIHRDGVSSVAAHVSEGALPVQDGEREIWNNDTIARLYSGVDLLMCAGARFIRVEPMALSVTYPPR